jgi:hypothetical protein
MEPSRELPPRRHVSLEDFQRYEDGSAAEASGELRALALTANDLEGDEDLGNALFKIARAVSAVGDEVHQRR